MAIEAVAPDLMRRMRAMVTALSTAAMAMSTLQQFILGALGPVLVQELGVVPWQLGALVAAGFGVATLLSVPAGAMVDRLGPRQSLIALFVLSGVALAVLATARSPWWIATGVALGGVPLALANPATNKLIRTTVEVDARGTVTGWKQSGVQLGTFVAGAPLAAVASVVSWRWGVGVLGALSLLGAWVAARLTVPIPHPAERTRRPVGARVVGLTGFTLVLGLGMAPVNTFLALYGADRLHLDPPVAAWLVAVMGLLGIAGRVLWSRTANSSPDPVRLLPRLGLGAAGAVGLVAIAEAAPWVVWPGAVGLGIFAVAGYAVSMVAVMRAAPEQGDGRAAGLVSAGFFAGFAIGPPAAGLLAQDAGYVGMWCAVALAFLMSSLIGVGLGRRNGPADRS
jgi:predicted MFS family arabinose efflux permease